MGNLIWSSEQEAIFNWFKTGRGNLVVQAFAGTGKTTTLCAAVDFAPESRILMTSFSVAAKEELQKKVRNPRVDVKNFHGLAFGCLKSAYRSLNVDKDRGWDLARDAAKAVTLSRKAAGKSAPIANDAQDAIVGLVNKIAGKGKNMLVEDAAGLAALAETFDHMPDEEWVGENFGDDDEDYANAVIYVAEAAAEAMRMALDLSASKIDFDDMIWLPVKLNLISGRYDMVVVDEAQDTNACQLAIALRSCKRGGRIVVCGDRFQAIYRFRGADSEALDRLKKELEAQELTLTITRRCPKKVVALAKEIIAQDYKAAPDAPDGEIKKARWEQLPGLVGPRDFVISRTNAPLVSACLSILRSGKRAKILGRDIGAGMISMVKSFKARSIPEFLQKLASWEKRMSDRAARAARTPAGAEAKVAEISDKAATLRALCEGLSGVKELEARITDLFVDGADKAPQVVCGTTHKLKGAEAENVFMLVDTYRQGPEVVQEERNCTYVAQTRSKATLTFVRSAGKEE